MREGRTWSHMQVTSLRVSGVLPPWGPTDPHPWDGSPLSSESGRGAQMFMEMQAPPLFSRMPMLGRDPVLTVVLDVESPLKDIWASASADSGTPVSSLKAASQAAAPASVMLAGLQGRDRRWRRCRQRS